MKKTILIIDTILSAGYLSSTFQNLNIRTVAVSSNMNNIESFNRPSGEFLDKQNTYERF